MNTGERIFEFIQATLNLFKAVPKIESRTAPEYTLANEENLENGFFVTINTFQNCPYVASKKILTFIRDKFGYDIFERNKNFYKSGKLANLSPKEALFDRIMGYLSSIGMESIEQSERDFLHIPNDVLKFPANADPVEIFIVGSVTKTEIKSLASKMIHSGEPLSGDQIDSLVEVIQYLHISFDLENIPNIELYVKLSERLQIVPKDPVQFLRQMVYIGTGSSLVIKNAETIADLKNSQTNFDAYFEHYIEENGIEKLASIFHRFKPLWLAFKPHSEYLQRTINKLRRLADRYHKPVEPKLLRNLTSTKNVDFAKLQVELSKITTYKKAALANALLYRNTAPENIAYNIRNGKTFVESYSGVALPNSKEIIDVITNAIVDDIRPKVRGRRIYIPENFNYAFPFGEKSFIGNIPYGSCYTFKSKACIIGVHWLNLFRNNDEIRVDLDLHLNGKGVVIDENNFDENKFVNAKDRKIIFSGDVTDAPLETDGATEVFLVGESIKNNVMLMNVRHYNRELFRLYKDTKNPPVPFIFILADVDQDKIDKNYLIYSYERAFLVPFEIKSGGMFLGFIVSDIKGEKKFYFCSRNLGSEIVARTSALADKFNDTMVKRIENCLSLNEILERAGAVLQGVTKFNCQIDLDPADVTRDTFTDLLENL